MKMSTSFSRQEASRQKCPKRFFFTYIDDSGAAVPYRRVKSIREVGGIVVHQEIAKICNGVGDGARVSDFANAHEHALRRFEKVITDARLSTEAEFRIAEFENGLDLKDEIDHWRTIVPLCVANARRVMLSLDLRSNSAHSTIIAEREISFKNHGRQHRGIIDLMIRTRESTLVVDWKCHAIENTDLRQVQHYQRYLHEAEGVPTSRLSGIAVDLIREELVESHYRPEQRLINRPRQRSILLELAPDKDPYPARPSEENCGRCAYTAICRDSVIRNEGRIEPIREKSA